MRILYVFYLWRPCKFSRNLYNNAFRWQLNGDININNESARKMSSITVKGEEALLSKCTELHQRSQLQIIQHERRSLFYPNNGGRYLTALFFLSIHCTRWWVRCWIWENFCTNKEEFHILFDVGGVTTAESVRWTQKKWTDNISLEINRVGHVTELLKLLIHCSWVKCKPTYPDRISFLNV